MSSYEARICRAVSGALLCASSATHLAVRGHRLALLDYEHVAGHDLARVDLALFAAADDGRLERDAGLELLDDIAGLFLLVPPDERVQHQNRNLQSARQS